MATTAIDRDPKGTIPAVDAALQMIGSGVSERFRLVATRAVARRLSETADKIEERERQAAAVTETSGKGGTTGNINSQQIAKHVVAALAQMGIIPPGASFNAGMASAPKLRTPATVARLSRGKATPKSLQATSGKRRGRPPGTKNLPKASLQQENGMEVGHLSVPDVREYIPQTSETGPE